jgi:hypothetical protein
MKKQLNVDTIQSELRGASAFFPGYKGTDSLSPSPKPAEQSITENQPRTTVPPVRDVREEHPGPPTKRVMKSRHPFDIYQDQYEALRELSLEERKQGGIGSMSAMVRQALDTYIAARREAEK